ncbi:hypothetical protein SK128_016706 [Halocaridina rubra]|uniref:Uncharacterized protein n=1 Tax=Halocaridina rubra TaxID=373956 RepID=A0AAN8WZK2_HALRR
MSDLDITETVEGEGGRAVAFEVAPPEEQSDSLIKKHPPRKFQKLEDQQQNTSLTQEILEEKQAIAEKRRQEILSQRVQSAKTRTARSAGGRLRARGSEADEVDQLEDGDIEGASPEAPDNEL